MQQPSSDTNVRAGWRGYLPTLYVVMAMITAGLFADQQHLRIEQQNERERVRTQVARLSTSIESSLNAPIQAGYGLVSTLSVEPNIGQRRFEWLSARVFDHLDMVINVGAAKDMVVNLVYPFEENQSAIGLDYNQNDAQRQDAFHVRDTGEFMLVGPVNLVQGGSAFIGRYPVFATQDDTHAFWGLLSFVIDIPSLYAQSGLTDPDLGLEVALVGDRSTGKDPFFGDFDVLRDDPVSTSVLFRNGFWELYARPIGGWGSTVHVARFQVLITLVVGAVCALAFMTNRMSLQRQATILTLQRREQQLEEARSEVEVLALHDHLTGLPNRRYLDRKLRQMSDADFPGLIQMDLDGFKGVNDSMGHSVGDQLLVQVADRLKDAAGSDTFLARSGGDEFVVLCLPRAGDDQTASERLEDTAKRLIDCVQPPFSAGKMKHRIGLSAGIHDVGQGGDLTPDEWLTQADHAMYRAKQHGRNRYLFSKQKETVASPVLYRNDELLEAVSAGQIIPYYQPQFSRDGRQVVGVEALARWQHPHLGIVSPKGFMGQAHSLKIENDLDQCILERATMDLAHWDDLGLNVPQISVNVSFRRLNDPNLMDMVDATGIDPSRIAFELLESIFLDDQNSRLTNNVEALKERGFRIEIDDFGTGYSSVTSLLRLRPHCFKIDRSLVQAAPASREYRRLLATITEMGHALNIEVCAEGIETQEQFRTARAVGCTMMQGYLLSRPMSADALQSFLAGEEYLRKGPMAG
ncbi:EAL domain-containing protein [Aestuariibius sp. HNIBRBA575]|uniref:bifunctional diguanylate cyclase/phosphodiesterase n=1 Tax=Aestuariibius sp. HNIBRBA575 TaxID=3233343 RepID=UPI0034A3C472